MAEKYETHLRLNLEEKGQLETDAKCCRQSKTAYLRRLIMDRPVEKAMSQEVKPLRMEIHQIGTNINQTAQSVDAEIANEQEAQQR